MIGHHEKLVERNFGDAKARMLQSGGAPQAIAGLHIVLPRDYGQHAGFDILEQEQSKIFGVGAEIPGWELILRDRLRQGGGDVTGVEVEVVPTAGTVRRRRR